MRNSATDVDFFHIAVIQNLLCTRFLLSALLLTPEFKEIESGLALQRSACHLQ